MRLAKETLLLIAAMLLFNSILTAQSFDISGMVKDIDNKRPLAFVNITINDGRFGGMTDIDGKYDIKSKEQIKSIKFSYLGYETQSFEVDEHVDKLNVLLKSTTYDLTEVTINAGENPAHRIIDSVMAHRKNNMPDHLKSYRYKMYDKMILTIDSSKLEQFQKMPELKGIFAILEKNDLMVMESVSELLYKSPDEKRQNVMATKISGIENPNIVYLVSSMQSVSFYDEYVSITDKKYINPISKGSKTKYFFNIENAMPTEDGDTLFTISFHPYKGTNFDALNGIMTIHSDGWALQNVKASPDKQIGMFSTTIQQLYEKVDGQWFPKQFNTNLIFSDIQATIDGESFSLAAIGNSYIFDIELNPEISDKSFSDIAVNIEAEAIYRDNDYWNQYRIDSLSERVMATYDFYRDSITPLINLDKVINSLEAIAEYGSVPVGCIDIRLDYLLNISFSRGLYLGFGAATNERFSKLFSLNAAAGYWFKQKKPDFCGGISFNLNKHREFKIDLRAYDKTVPVGAFDDFDGNTAILFANNYKYLYENVDALAKAIELESSRRIGRHLKGFVKLSVSDKTYLKQYEPLKATFPEERFTTAELKLRFAYKEKFVSTTKGIKSIGTDYPIVWFSYLHSFKDIMNGKYEYNRFQLQVEDFIYTKYYGATQILLQAGLVQNGAPLTETFDLIGSYDNWGLYAPGSFNTMRGDEFFSDRFVALFLTHNFGNLLFQTNSSLFKPELSLITNIGWGKMKNSFARNPISYRTMEKGYYESGFVIDGILSTPLTKLGFGAFYRYGPYSYDKVWDNITIKWSVVFTF